MTKSREKYKNTATTQEVPMTTSENTKQSNAIAVFFAALEALLDDCLQKKKSYIDLVQIAAFHRPHGAEINYLLMRDKEGNVWEQTRKFEGIHLLYTKVGRPVGSWERYQPIVPAVESICQPDWVGTRKSMIETWSWEVTKRPESDHNDHRVPLVHLTSLIGLNAVTGIIVEDLLTRREVISAWIPADIMAHDHALSREGGEGDIFYQRAYRFFERFVPGVEPTEPPLSIFTNQIVDALYQMYKTLAA